MDDREEERIVGMDRAYAESEAEVEHEDEHGALGQYDSDWARTPRAFWQRSHTSDHAEDWRGVCCAPEQCDRIQHHATCPATISIQVEQLQVANTEPIDAASGQQVLEDDEGECSVEIHQRSFVQSSHMDEEDDMG